jgi:major membrane immunogen (membrane-anchored lipoprotein)
VKSTIVMLSIILLMALISCRHAVKNFYNDGLFTGESRSIYTDEPYYGITTVSIQNGNITAVKFQVVDKDKNEVFDEKYENHFKDIPLYIQQCRNDWQGIQTYPGRFLKVGEIDRVDAITGATWSYNLFKASLTIALEKAKNR